MWKEGKQIQVADQATTYQNVQLLNGEVTGKHYVSEDPSSMRNREWTSQILPICCLSLVKFIVGHELTCTCSAPMGKPWLHSTRAGLQVGVGSSSLCLAGQASTCAWTPSKSHSIMGLGSSREGPDKRAKALSAD